MSLPIKQTIERIPGGMMLVPLLLGCVIANLAPGTPRQLFPAHPHRHRLVDENHGQS